LGAPGIFTFPLKAQVGVALCNIIDVWIIFNMYYCMCPKMYITMEMNEVCQLALSFEEEHTDR
jgi:hypothetical protein